MTYGSAQAITSFAVMAIAMAGLFTLAPCAHADPLQKKSIRNWTRCDGKTDDARGAAAAFAAASHDAFVLLVDCPVRLQIGSDVARPIIIDNGTHVDFSSAGQFIVDDVFQPAFVIADSSGIELTNWDILWNASLPTNPDVGGYDRDGKHVVATGNAQPAAAWHDSVLAPWLTQQRKIVFDKSQGNVGPTWVGPTNTSAMFYIDGDASQIKIIGMKLHVPTGAGPEHYIPMAFSFSTDYLANQTVNKQTPRTAQYQGMPHDLRFENIDLDGTYMGWQGNLYNAVFTHIRSHRYADLQDADGGNVGGAKKWFAPPHLFYLNYATGGDAQFFNRNIKITDVVDDGSRAGTARDKGGGDTTSGYALSLKLGCVDCQVDGYTSSRPDGFLDLLRSERLTMSNVNAKFDSGFVNGLFPGWRFPDAPYKDVTIHNVTLTDTAANSVQQPMGSASGVNNSGLRLYDITIMMNHWGGTGPLTPTIAGDSHDVNIRYVLAADNNRVVFAQKGRVTLTLQVPNQSTGNSAVVTWSSKGANRCSASGAALSGDLPPSGTRNVAANSVEQLQLSCTDGNDVALADVRERRKAATQSE